MYPYPTISELIRDNDGNASNISNHIITHVVMNDLSGRDSHAASLVNLCLPENIIIPMMAKTM